SPCQTPWCRMGKHKASGVGSRQKGVSRPNGISRGRERRASGSSGGGRHQTSGPKITPQPSRTNGPSGCGSQHQIGVTHQRQTPGDVIDAVPSSWLSGPAQRCKGCEPGAAADGGGR
ncbi:MAG: hypothetical protein RMJ19_08215, partial [Gemmatales bacterium]|nr:hypothetical protein [Gemmatales bacterium]MDW8175642.1 hypothetical protein [Gemmatales bacterium]